jgi:hypothetical protein
MSVANDVFRRISPQLRTFRIALTVSDDECVLMDDLRVRRKADGTLECRTERKDDLNDGDGLLHNGYNYDHHEGWSSFSPIVGEHWIVGRVGIRANMLWRNMLTDEERKAIAAERPAGRELDPDAGVGPFIRRLMRRLLGYHQTAKKAASLCSLAMARMMDPRLSIAIRQICGWRAENHEAVIQAWSRTDAAGRQIGLSGRPYQVGCMALMMRRHIERQDDGVVGILDAMPGVSEIRYAEYESYVADPNQDEYVPSMGASRVEDLCEIADLLPAALRSAGVKPAFWRMVLRMTPAQVRSLNCLLTNSWTPETTALLNALSSIDEKLLRPMLLRTLAQRWINGGWEAPQRAIVLAVLHRATVGIAARRSRQSLTEAVQKLLEVVDHVSHVAGAKARADREALGLTWDDERPPVEGRFALDWYQESKETTDRKARDTIATLRTVLPHTRDWNGLVAASDVWHQEAILAMDEKDDRTWVPLLVNPVAIGDVVVTELNSAALLRQESRELNHCVGLGGYTEGCMSGQRRILSFRLKGVRTRSTMEVLLREGVWQNVQHRGRSNSVPKPALLAAEKAAVKALNAAQKAASKAKAANDDQQVALAA